MKRKRFNSIQQFDISIRETDFQAKRGRKKARFILYIFHRREKLFGSQCLHPFFPRVERDLIFLGRDIEREFIPPDPSRTRERNIPASYFQAR